MVKPFLPKDDQAIPDNYGAKIFYVTGKSEEFSLASHRYNKETDIFEFWTEEDICSWVKMSSVLRIEFDKNFSKIVALRKKEKMEAKENDKKTKSQ